MNLNPAQKRVAMHGLTSVLMFLLPALCLVTSWGVGLGSLGFFLLALLHFQDCQQALARHWDAIWPVLAAFLVHCLFVGACVLLRDGERASELEQSLRMLLGASALTLVLVFRPDARMLWWGVAAGALGGALLVAAQRVLLGLDRPGGLVNAITAGDVLVCLALVSLAALADLRARRMAWVAWLGAVAGLAGALSTGTRGGLPALLLAAPLLLRYAGGVGARQVHLLVLGGAVLAAALWLVPQTGVRARALEGVNDIRSYLAGGSTYTNLGVRFEMWRGAAMLVAERPWLGSAQGQAMAQLAAQADAGRFEPAVKQAGHFHNDALQALVTGGVIGLLAWLATLLAPLVFFVRLLRAHVRAGAVNPGLLAPALAGTLVVVSYAGFGLTEVIFWSMRASLLYALLVFLLMGLCLNAKEIDGK